MKRLAALAAAALLLLAGCAGGRGGGKVPPVKSAAPEPLAGLLARPDLAERLRQAPELRIQIVLGLLEDGADGQPALRQLPWRAGEEYFYPASAVKLFAAVAALEKLHQLQKEMGLEIGVDTPLIYHPLFAGEKLENAEAGNLEGGKITVRHELRKLFLVSDNEAYNKFYEMVGQDGLAASLSRAGLTGVRLVHRLDEFRSPEENRRSPRIDFVGVAGRGHTLPERLAPEMALPPPFPGILVGKGYMSGGRKVRQPMDFSGKNRFPLTELQRGLCKVLLPEVDCGSGGSFQLDEKDRAMLREVMGQYPRESKNPVYSAADYPDPSGKFLLPGLLRVIPKENLRIYNKFGQAYGFSTENALVTNTATGKNLFFAATIYTNADGILNDDNYDYEKVARPFFASLGEGLAELLK